MNQYAQFETHTNPMKHSGLGIASFIISLLNGVLMLILVIASAAMVNEGLTENDPGIQLLGVVLLGSVVLTMVGGVFGIITCFQKTRKKIFGIIGLILNAMTFLGIIILMIIGIAEGA